MPTNDIDMHNAPDVNPPSAEAMAPALPAQAPGGEPAPAVVPGGTSGPASPPSPAAETAPGPAPTPSASAMPVQPMLETPTGSADTTVSTPAAPVAKPTAQETAKPTAQETAKPTAKPRGTITPIAMPAPGGINAKSLPAALSQMLRAKRLCVSEGAAEIGIPEAVLGRVLLKLAKPDSRSLPKFAAWLGCPTAQLMTAAERARLLPRKPAPNVARRAGRSPTKIKPAPPRRLPSALLALQQDRLAIAVHGAGRRTRALLTTILKSLNTRK